MRNIKRLFHTSVTFLAFMASWHVAATLVDSPNFPDVTQIYHSWSLHWFNGTLSTDLITTLRRVLVSFLGAMFLGSALGILLGSNQRLNQLFDPILLFFLNLPALVTIILCYIWIGLVEPAAIIAVMVNKVPLVIVTIREGVRVIDKSLMDLAFVYRVSSLRTFWFVYLPQLYSYLLAAARNGLALIWKIVLVVELLGRSDGIGFGIYNLFQFFDIAGILAYALTFMVFMFAIDILVFRQVEGVIQKGRSS